MLKSQTGENYEKIWDNNWQVLINNHKLILIFSFLMSKLYSFFAILILIYFDSIFDC